ncbi:MFS transporter [Cardiobacteriaceae bacterium TAE3-ERU3]|nr:MFS transporter [Cardiobacteriaceae bacterium TAE3-ERU3]
MSKQEGIAFKAALLGISIFLLSHLAIAPAIPKLYQLYQQQNPDIGLASVESLVTMPAAMITLFVLLSDGVARRLGKKRTVLLGLGLTLMAGVAPFFLTDFVWVMVSRVLLGIGIGLYNALSISLLSDFYHGQQRSNMIGLRTSFLNIGKALTTFIAGYALIYGAEYTFLVYVLVVPVWILFVLYVPEPQLLQHQQQNRQAMWGKNTFGICLLTFLVGVCYIGATVKIPTLLVSYHGLGDDDSRNMLTVLAISGTLLGFVFGQIFSRLQGWMLSLMLLIMALGNVLFASTSSVALLYLGSIFIGLAFVGTMSSIFCLITQQFAAQKVLFVTSMALAAGNIGALAAPAVLTKLPELLGFDHLVMPFYITTAILLVSMVANILLAKPWLGLRSAYN